MSTATLNNLLEYLYGTLSRNDMRWVADHLIEHANREENYDLTPYTMEEINAMLDAAEADIAAGRTTPHEKAMRELDEKIARWKQESHLPQCCRGQVKQNGLPHRGRCHLYRSHVGLPTGTPDAS